MKTFITVMITVVVMVLLAVGVGMVLRKKGMVAQEKPTVVRLATPAAGDLVEFVTAPGQLKPKVKVALSARVSARIIDMPYKQGARVTKEDPNANPPVPPSLLVRLDAKDLEANLRSAEARRSAQAAEIEVQKAQAASARANLARTMASLQQAERDLKRQRGLLASHDVSESAVDQLQSQADELKAQYEATVHGLKAAELSLEVLGHNLEAADAEIARARDTLSYTVITSPIDGVVTRVNAEVGELVMTGTMNNPGTVIMEVADLSRMLVVAQVDESKVEEVKPGQETKVRIQAYPDRTFKGVVDTVALMQTSSAGGVKYFETEILLQSEGAAMYSGLTADVDIETKRHSNVIKAPSQAILARNVDDLPLKIRENNPNVDTSKTFATVVYRCQNGQAVVTPVKIGASDATDTEIQSGLSSEDRIIVGPYKVLESIKHEQKVQDEKEAEAQKQKDANAVKDKKKGDANSTKDSQTEKNK